MPEEKESFFAAGIDISDDMTQAAYFMGGMNKPLMAGKEYEENEFLIPTAIEKAKEDWIIGKDCNTPITKLFSKAQKGIIEDGFDTVELFAIFAEKVVRKFVLPELLLSDKNYPDVIVFTLPKTDKNIIGAVRRHFNESDLAYIRLVFITHSESCIYYALNQEKEIRVKDIAFFDFSKERLLYRKFHMARVGKKQAIEVTECDYTEHCDYERRNDEAFMELVCGLFEKQPIFSVFLLGEGFEDDTWAKESLNYICGRRRVFKGRNLYALGACYKAMEGYGDCFYDTYIILCKGRTLFEICMEVVFKEEKNEAVLIPAGEFWYDIQPVDVDGILYNADRINIIVYTVTGSVVKKEEILLTGFPCRKERMTRVRVGAVMNKEDEVLITVSDLGFGEFAEGSGLQIVKNIQCGVN